MCTKLVSFTRLYRDARSTEHKIYAAINYLHALITSPGSKHSPHKFVPKHFQCSCFLARELVFTPTQNTSYDTRYKNLFISHIHIVFTNLSIIYLKFCKVTKAQNRHAYLHHQRYSTKKSGTFVKEAAILLFTIIFRTYGKTF